MAPFLLPIIFLFLGWFPLHAQQELRCEHLSERDGLSQSEVLSMLQDQDGFMWFGTRDGLNMYDGYSFTMHLSNFFDLRNSFWQNIVRCLYEEKAGRLWIESGGLHLLINKSGKMPPFLLYSTADNYLNLPGERGRNRWQRRILSGAWAEKCLRLCLSK